MAKALNFTLPVATLKHLSMTKLGISTICAAIECEAITFKEENSEDNNYDEMKRNYGVLRDRTKSVIPQNQREYFERLLHIILNKFHNEYDEVQYIFSESRQILLPKEIYRHFVFSSRGHRLVDPTKSCASITRDETLDLIFRFRLACNYYLEESIHDLWNQMKPADFYQFDVATIKESENDEVMLWSLKMLGMEDEMVTYLGGLNPWFPELTLNALAFKRELEIGNEHGAKYFFKKLNEAGKGAVLDNFLIDPDVSDGTTTLYFSFLSGPRLEKALNDYGVLPLFRDLNTWEFNELFPQMFESLRPFIDEESYFQILLMLSKSDAFLWDVPVFDVMWSHAQVPDSYRDYFFNRVGEDGVADLLCELFSLLFPSGKWSIDIVMRSADKEQLRIVFAGLLDRIATRLPQNKCTYAEMELLKICAQIMVTSKADLDFAQKASSPTLNDEASWQSFLGNMTVMLERSNERKREGVYVEDVVPAKKRCPDDIA